MSAQMEAAITKMGGISGMAKQLAALGEVVEISPAYEGEIKGFTAYYIPCVFSLMSADIVLVVQDGAVAGLQTGAYSGGQEEKESGAFERRDLALPVPSLGELPGVLTVPEGETSALAFRSARLS